LDPQFAQSSRLLQLPINEKYQKLLFIMRFQNNNNNKIILGIIQQVIKGCPNIEKLHIGVENENRTQPMAIDYFSEFKFKHLRRLSIKITKFIQFEFDGSYLPPVVVAYIISQ